MLVVFQEGLDVDAEPGQRDKIVIAAVVLVEGAPGTYEDLVVFGLINGDDKVVLQTMGPRPRIIMPDDLSARNIHHIQAMLIRPDPKPVPHGKQSVDIVIGDAAFCAGGFVTDKGSRLCIEFVYPRVFSPDPEISVLVLADLVDAVTADRRCCQPGEILLEEYELLRQVVQAAQVGSHPQPALPVLTK